MTVVSELIAVLGYDLRNEAALGRWRAGLRSAETQLAALAAAANRYGKIAAAAIGAGSVLFGKQVLQVGSQFEAYDIQLTTLLGSQEKAKEAMTWIQNFAKTTPLSVAEVTEAFASLKNFGIDPTNGSLLAMTDAMAGSGKGTETLKRLTLALGQAWVKQKLQGQEILQLTEAGIPVWDMLAAATGKNVMELQKLSEKGKLGRKEIQLLIDAIGKKYAGASDKFSKSMAGITSRLGDEWQQFLLKIADAGFFDTVKRQLEAFQANVDRWAADGSLDRWAKRISDALTAVAKAVAVIADRIMTHGEFIANWLASLDDSTVLALAAAFGLLLARLFPGIWAFGVLLAAAEDFLTWLEGGESKFGDFIAWIQEMTGASEGLATALAAVVASLALMMAMKPFAILKGIGRFLAGFVSGAAGAWAEGTAAAGGAAAGAGGAAATKGGIRGLLGRVLPKFGTLASLLLLAGDTPTDQRNKRWEDTATDDQLDEVTKFRDWDRPAGGGGSTRGRGRDRGTVERDKSLDSFIDGPPRPVEESSSGDGFAKMLAGMDNLKANIGKMTAGAAAGAVVTDNSQDNRSYPVNVSAPVSVTVNEAAAPMAVGNAISGAIGKAAVAQSSRTATGPQL